VLCHQIKSLDWRARGERPHPFGRPESDQLEQVLEIVDLILGVIP